jgi:hypothetical protein
MLKEPAVMGTNTFMTVLVVSRTVTILESLRGVSCAGFVRQKRRKEDSIYVPSLFYKRLHRLPPFFCNEPGTGLLYYILWVNLGAKEPEPHKNLRHRNYGFNCAIFQKTTTFFGAQKRERCNSFSFIFVTRTL